MPLHASKVEQCISTLGPARQVLIRPVLSGVRLNITMRRRSLDDIYVGASTRDDSDDEGLSGWRSASAPRERGDLFLSLGSRHRPAMPPLRELPGRNHGRLVPLGPAWEGYSGSSTAQTPVPDNTRHATSSSVFLEPERVPSQFLGPGMTVRVTCYCVGQEFDRAKLQDHILKRSSASSVQAYPEVLVSQYRLGVAGSGDAAGHGDIFYFDWGTVVFWGLERSAELHILREIAQPCLSGDPLPLDRRERDRLMVHYSVSPKTAVQNDALALPYRFAGDLEVKLAVSFALAQSTKLSVAEEDLRRMGKALAYVPNQLALSGEVPLPERAVMRAVGELYKQMSAVTLLGAALDLPDAMASAGTNIRDLYKAVYDYLEVSDRMATINERFEVMREMLELCRTLGQAQQFSMLESIIMWLVGICVVLAMFQLLGFLVWRPAWRP